MVFPGQFDPVHVYYPKDVLNQKNPNKQCEHVITNSISNYSINI